MKRISISKLYLIPIILNILFFVNNSFADGVNSPKETIYKFINLISDNNFEQACKYISDEDCSYILALNSDKKNVLSIFYKNSKYKILNESIVGGHSKVSVYFKSPDIGSSIGDYIVNNIEENNYNYNIDEYIKGIISDNEYPKTEYTYEYDLYLDGYWKIKFNFKKNNRVNLLLRESLAELKKKNMTKSASLAKKVLSIDSDNIVAIEIIKRIGNSKLK